nr:hypothetical protein [Bacillaceae bacterium]
MPHIRFLSLPSTIMNKIYQSYTLKFRFPGRNGDRDERFSLFVNRDNRCGKAGVLWINLPGTAIIHRVMHKICKYIHILWTIPFPFKAGRIFHSPQKGL